MTSEIKKKSFSLSTKLLHWLIAGHMSGLIVSGWWIVDLSFYSSWYYSAPALHKSFGAVVFLMGLLLLISKFRKRPPPLESHTKLEKLASKFAHLLLFASLITIPVSGYIFTTFTGQNVSIFNTFDIPAVLVTSEKIRDLAIQFHIYASYGIAVVVFVHAGGALKHHLLDKDRTLRRMLW